MATHPKKKSGKPPRKRVNYNRTWWTDDQRHAALAALDANGGDVPKTSREIGIPHQTLYAWKNGRRHAEGSHLWQDKKGNLSEACEDLAWHFAAVIPSKIDSAPLSSMMTGFGILVDKMRLLRGESTSIGDNRNQNLNVNLVELVKRLSHDERSQLESIILAALGSPGRSGALGNPDGEGGRPTPELSPVPESGVPGSGPLDAIQG